MLFRELASNETYVVPIETIQLRTLDEIPDKNEAKNVNVFAIRTEGKRIPGREIVQYLSIGEFLNDSSTAKMAQLIFPFEWAILTISAYPSLPQPF